MSNCVIAQSGGPTAAINASLSGVIEASLGNPEIKNIYGSLNGIVGILNDRLLDLKEIFDEQPDKIQTLKNTPGMYLGSCRYKLKNPLEDDSEFRKIFSVFEKYDIKYFFYIGGNDSMDTVDKLSVYAAENKKDIRIIGIPKTVDNDLCQIDHTPGFGSAAKYVATSLLEIAHDIYIYDVKSVTIVEVMGRNAGWLTAASALARNSYNASPDLIYCPEITFSKENFLKDVENCFKKKKNIIVVVSEGIKDQTGTFISASSENEEDSFGHVMLSGTGKVLENLITNTFSCKARSIELNILQRSAMHSASLTDIYEANLLGKKAVEFALEGQTGKMVSIIRLSDEPYLTKIDTVNVSDVANKEKTIPREWLNDAGNDVTQELVDYLKPLILGEISLRFLGGLPTYAPIPHLIG